MGLRQGGLVAGCHAAGLTVFLAHSGLCLLVFCGLANYASSTPVTSASSSSASCSSRSRARPPSSAVRLSHPVLGPPGQHVLGVRAGPAGGSPGQVRAVGVVHSGPPCWCRGPAACGSHSGRVRLSAIVCLVSLGLQSYAGSPRCLPSSLPVRRLVPHRAPGSGRLLALRRVRSEVLR